MGLFETKSSTSKTKAVFDIRSGSIGAAIVVTSEEEKPEVVWSHRKPISFMKEHDTSKLINMTKQAVDSAAERLQKVSSKITGKTDISPVQEIQCFFAAPWYVGSTQTVTINKDNPFTVDEERMNLARQKADELFREETVANHTKKEEDLEELDEAVFGIWCNGYRLNKPQEVATNTLRVAIYKSMLPTQIANITREAIGSRLNTDQLHFNSFTAAVSRLFTNVFDHPKSFLLVDAGDELTEILLVENGVLTESVSFPLGEHFLTRTVAKSLDRPPSDARSRLQLYLDNHQTSEHKQEIDDVVTEAKDRWQELFASSIGEFSPDVSLPSHAYVLSGHSVGSLLTDFVSDTSVKDHLVTRSRFRVHEVDSELLSSRLHTKRSAVDHFLAASVLSACEARVNKT